MPMDSDGSSTPPRRSSIRHAPSTAGTSANLDSENFGSSTLLREAVMPVPFRGDRKNAYSFETKQYRGVTKLSECRTNFEKKFSSHSLESKPRTRPQPKSNYLPFFISLDSIRRSKWIIARFLIGTSTNVTYRGKLYFF